MIRDMNHPISDNFNNNTFYVMFIYTLFKLSLLGYNPLGYRFHSIWKYSSAVDQSFKNILDKNEFAGATFIDLSKAFDSMNHNLLIAKLHTYRLSINALELIQCYLSTRKQRVKINSTYSAWKEVKVGAPQGSVLSPLLFNIFINDILLFVMKYKFVIMPMTPLSMHPIETSILSSAT